ncbi:MAG: hypothetical protein KGJ62_01220 [Armatimonadetes bacterium]|nr:hypothetical protein [Armatimonadota bacterium]MDE2207904.1 hypothetical protein [Armatimonadota bacterium]
MAAAADQIHAVLGLAMLSAGVWLTVAAIATPRSEAVREVRCRTGFPAALLGLLMSVVGLRWLLARFILTPSWLSDLLTIVEGMGWTLAALSWLVRRTRAPKP